MDRIYMDNAATTRPNEPVMAEAQHIMRTMPYNASSVYGEAQAARERIEEARAWIADSLSAKPNEVYFTSGGTESDNWAIKGAALRAGSGHIITSAIEHHAVLHACEYLQSKGFELTILPVDEYGIVSPEDVEKAVRDDTILISIMFANNEIGTIQPIEAIGEIAERHGVLFHTDAVQAYGKLKIDVERLHIDLLSISAHKIHGLKGTGVLYVRSGAAVDPLMHGGAQERKKRAGTENLMGIAALEVAARESLKDRTEKNARLASMTQKLVQTVLRDIPHARLNGHPTERLPGNVNVSFSFIEGESLLMMLERQGIMASSGSACTSGSLDPSHVLLALGLPHEEAHGSLRISLDDWENDEEQVERLLAVLPDIVERLRAMSPLYEDYVKGESDV